VIAGGQSELEIITPEMYPKQTEIAEHPAKRKVVCAGRRAGKTTLAAVMAIDHMLDGRRVLLASTTQEQSDAFWDKAKAWLAPVIEAGIVGKNEARRILTFGTTGRIRVKTGRDADVLRGDFADFLVLDECALLDPKAWDEVAAPMLADNDGDAMFISTPRRRNWFHGLYLRGVDDTGDGRWHSWHFTSHDNPHLSAPALAEITHDMTSEAYRQEIMAEFLEGEGAVFRNIAACLTAPETTPAEHAGHHIVAGCDWARQADYSAFSLVCRDCRVEVARDRFNQIDYHVQVARLKALCDKWTVATILAETNSIGTPVLEMLQRLGLPVRGFETTASSKPPLIESLALAFEREECRWQADPVWTGELEAYERKVSATTGRSQYSAPEGGHDDTVMARALAWQACDRSPTGGIFV